MAKAVTFTNYSDEDFTHKWDGVEYDFPKGQSTMLEFDLALHFAKHLANRELNKKGVEYVTTPVLEEEMKKAISTENAIEEKDETKLKQAALNYNEMNREELAEEAKKRGITVGNKKESTLVSDLEAFEGE